MERESDLTKQVQTKIHPAHLAEINRLVRENPKYEGYFQNLAGEMMQVFFSHIEAHPDWCPYPMRQSSVNKMLRYYVTDLIRVEALADEFDVKMTVMMFNVILLNAKLRGWPGLTEAIENGY